MVLVSSFSLLSQHTTRLPYPRCRIWPLSFWNVIWLVIAQSSDLLRSLCRASLLSRESTGPPNLVSSANLLGISLICVSNSSWTFPQPLYALLEEMTKQELEIQNRTNSVCHFRRKCSSLLFSVLGPAAQPVLGKSSAEGATRMNSGQPLCSDHQELSLELLLPINFALLLKLFKKL